MAVEIAFANASALYGRGARLISSVGGCTTGTLAEGVHRSPGFAFASTTEAGLFVAWVCENFDLLKATAETTTRHGKLVENAGDDEVDDVANRLRVVVEAGAGWQDDRPGP